jgi:hypothetical protein
MTRGDRVTITDSGNPHLDGTPAKVLQNIDGWLLLEAPAAKSGRYRALPEELTPDPPPAPVPVRAKEPDKPLAEFSGVARRTPILTGETCPKCGAFVRMDGGCKICTGCGDRSGGCG